MSQKSPPSLVGPVAPPVARRLDQPVRLHGVELNDPYAWLRNRDDPEVLSYLEAENAWVAARMAPTTELQDRLYREIVARIPENDETVPVVLGDYEYFSRFQEGLQYSIRCRRPLSAAGGTAETGSEKAEEVLLDLNELAGEGGYLDVGVYRISPDHRLLAYSVDTNGSERYTLRVKNLGTGELSEEIEGTARGAGWSADGRWLFYTTRDESQRPYRVFRHRLGTPASEDVLVYEERDSAFFLSLYETRSRRFLVLHLGTHTTAELRVLDTRRPEEPFRLVARRRPGIEMELSHLEGPEGQEGSFFLCTNLGADYFRVLEVPESALEQGSCGASAAPDDRDARELWGERVAERPGVVLEGVDAFRDHLLLWIRRQGQRRLEVVELASGERHEVAFDEPVHSVTPTDNLEYHTTTLRFSYSSFVTPRSIYDYDMASRERVLRKRTDVGEAYDAERYEILRLEASSADGTAVPISLVRPRSLPRDGAHPLLLYGYGSYGTCIEPRFSPARPSLLDRGVSYAIAHVRGGGELGRPWYEAGKLGDKERTFDDFIAAAEHLVAEGYTSPRGLVARGGSAGGLLVGAVINRRPDLFHAALAEVPFVDVLNTMLDATIPLTVIEYGEWGNPADDAEAFGTILDYSPYENVGSDPYPHLLVTAGLHDPRVQYWEPAKWVARMRRRTPGEQMLFLRTDLGSGHGGASGRYDSLREEAFKLAFVLHALDTERSGPGPSQTGPSQTGPKA